MSESVVHPMLTNIRALADATTWQKSIDLADEALLNWWKTPRVIQQVYLVGHGSSLFNGLVGQYVIEHIVGIPSKAIPAFAFSKYMEPRLLGPQTLVISISTTGGTQSVFDALEYAHQAGSSTLAITAHKDSAIAQNAEAVILTGGEDDQISVKTKSYVQALIPLYMLAIHLAGDAQVRNYWLNQINLAAQGAQRFLQEGWDQINQLAETYGSAQKVFVLGTGPNLGTAEEASLKVIEMAKMYSECQELEDFFHGRLREVDQNSPMFFIAPNGRSNRRVLDFLTVMDTIHAPAIVITDQVTSGIQHLATQVIQIPVSLDEFATPLLYILPMYIFGYEMALQRGYDPTARRYNIVPQNVRFEGEE
jgi:Glucosamine 6-phosphate synthetase, contains amidotransferase and phosphosugar isomerase domains